MKPLMPSVVDAMGDTPLVELSRLANHLSLEGRLLAKLDNMLPGYSKKDRAARAIIESARADGRLKPGQPVVELTSGNMGTGLAIVCAVYGHPFIAVMSEGNSMERARMIYFRFEGRRGTGVDSVDVAIPLLALESFPDTVLFLQSWQKIPGTTAAAAKQ